MVTNSRSINFNPTYKKIKKIYNNYLSNYVEGSVCIVSSSVVSSATFTAIKKIVDSLGFDTGAVVFVSLHPELPDAKGADGTAQKNDESDSESNGSHGDGVETSNEDYEQKTGELSAADLFELIEGIDPLCAVVTDKTAAQAMANAYRHPINLDRMNRVFGRNVAAFTSFDEMLTSKVQKAEAWSVLKKLTKL